MDYKGVIIEESLTNLDIINELEVISSSISESSAASSTPWVKQWTLKTVIIPENKIEFYCEKLATLIDKEHANSWYCDYINDKYHYVIFSNKFFKLDRTNKTDYIKMINYGIQLGIPQNQLPTFIDLPTSLLTNFLIEAKTATYANSNAEKITSTRIGSKDYEYTKEIQGELMTYHDTYFGGTKFVGEEVVYRGSTLPKWGMNYHGVTLDSSLSEEAMDKALRPALMQVGKDRSVLPVRGPGKFQNGNYTYTFECEGTLENFTGTEKIYKDNILIYILHCHGGIIQ